MSKPITKVCLKCHRTILPDKTRAIAFFRSCCDPCFKEWYDNPTPEPTETTKSQVLGVVPLSLEARRWKS